MTVRSSNAADPLTLRPRVGRPGARETQVARRQVHFAAKSAPQHRDFAAGKVEVI